MSEWVLDNIFTLDKMRYTKRPFKVVEIRSCES